MEYVSIVRNTLVTETQEFWVTLVSPLYDPYVGERLLERTLVLGHGLFEEGWPVPFLAASISSVFPPGLHTLLGGQ